MTHCLQLTGALLVPFVVEMETLFLAALFRPLNERLFIPQLSVIQVCQRLSSGLCRDLVCRAWLPVFVERLQAVRAVRVQHSLLWCPMSA